MPHIQINNNQAQKVDDSSNLYNNRININSLLVEDPLKGKQKIKVTLLFSLYHENADGQRYSNNEVYKITSDDYGAFAEEMARQGKHSVVESISAILKASADVIASQNSQYSTAKFIK